MQARSFRTGSELGGVMVETAICVPVLILLAIGIMQLGQALVQLNWVGRTAYNSALLATYTAQAEIEQAVSSRTQALHRMTHYLACGDGYSSCGAELSEGVPLIDGSMKFHKLIDSTVTGRTSVMVKYEATAASLGSIPGIRADMQVVGPYLVGGVALPNSDSFSNPSCTYGACGTCSCGPTRTRTVSTHPLTAIRRNGLSDRLFKETDGRERTDVTPGPG